jgi:hypothetical protein
MRSGPLRRALWSKHPLRRHPIRRCTGATWDDAVVIFPGEVLAFQNIERQAHALRAPAPGTVVETHPLRRHPIRARTISRGEE